MTPSIQVSPGETHLCLEFLYAYYLISGRMWQPQMERLPDYHCLAPDLPEQGKSRNAGPFHLEDAAKQVIALMDECVPGRHVHLVGLSLGADLALAMMQIAPAYIDHVIASAAAPLGKVLGTFVVVVGGQEGMVAKRGAKKVAMCLKHAQGVVVPGVNHVWNLQAPDLFTDTLRAWIEDRPLPGVLRPLT